MYRLSYPGTLAGVEAEVKGNFIGPLTETNGQLGKAGLYEEWQKDKPYNYKIRDSADPFSFSGVPLLSKSR